MSIGENIRRLRIERNISQTELANAVGCSDKAISAWEHDTRVPRNMTLIKIADFFGVSLDYLTGRPSTASDFWRILTLASPFPAATLALKLGISMSELSYLEHNKDEKVSTDTYKKLFDIYMRTQTAPPIKLNVSEDLYDTIEKSDVLLYQGQQYKLEQSDKEKLHAAIRLALM